MTRLRRNGADNGGSVTDLELTSKSVAIPSALQTAKPFRQRVGVAVWCRHDKAARQARKQ